MEIKIALEWDEQIGISLNKMYPLCEGLEEFFKQKQYGNSINTIWIVMTALGDDVKQRKKFKKEIQQFGYDILLDYFLIKNVDLEMKKNIIRKQIVEITEQTFSKYKFDDFDKDTFLSDLKKIVYTVAW